MSTIKSKPISMIDQGRLKVAVSLSVIHKNADDEHSASVFVYGAYNGNRVPIIYTQGDSVAPSDADATAIPNGKWYRIESKAVGVTSAFSSSQTAGNIYYNNTGASISMAAGAAISDEATILDPVAFNVGAGYVGSVIKARWAPCEIVMYECYDTEYSKIRAWKLNTSTPVDIHEAAE